MRQSNRAVRRHHDARMKKKAREYYPHDKKATLSNHLTACSCPACGNPRRHFGEVTMQERHEMLRG